jgi:hypothetical protein
MRSRAAAIPVVLVAAFLLQGGSCSRPSRSQCPSHPACRIVADADADGEISDDLRVARNALVYGSTAGRSEVYLYPPPAGTYDWLGEVRFCGDETPPAGAEEEPNCTGTGEIPRIVFLGRWQDVTLAGRCADPATALPEEISACLHFGDRMLGDGGAGEPRVEVETSFRLVFQHAESLDFAVELNHPVYAVWLDGVTQSLFGVTAGRDAPENPAPVGSGAYISASSSSIHVELTSPDGGLLYNGVVIDGDMTGSSVQVVNDRSAAPGGMDPAVSVGSGSGSALNLFVSGPADGCMYGPDTDGCVDFDLDLAVRTPANSLGGEALRVIDGSFDLDLDVEYLTGGHYAMTLASRGEIYVTGSLVYRGISEQGTVQAPAIDIVRDGTVALDLRIESLLWDDPTCLHVGPNATVLLGPSYQCFGPSGP